MRMKTEEHCKSNVDDRITCSNCGGSGGIVHGSGGMEYEDCVECCSDCGGFGYVYPEDVCSLCGKAGADKVAHPVSWPGERSYPGTYVHADCENAECGRAHAELSDAQREAFLRTL